MKVYRREGLASAVRQRRAEVSRSWRSFPTLMRFLADHFPDRWERIARCRLSYKTYEARGRPGFFKLVPHSCHEVPFCISCVRAGVSRRVHAALSAFNRCTPQGKNPRFIHIVQTAPIYDDGGGWGVEASNNVHAFGGIVWGALREAYGEGIGAVMSYQDFGERAFAKRHPHIDLTLNGWMLQGEKAISTSLYDLKGSGWSRWHESIVKRATSLRLDAQPGNVKFFSPLVGVPAYFGVLRYQMRELVDFRKLEYSRDQGAVWWKSYKDHRRERFTVQGFLDGLAEYQRRLGTWQSEGREALHRRYGHLGDRLIRTTQRLVGGKPIPHGKACPCSDCGDWDRVFLDEVDAAVGRAAPLNVR